MAEKKLKGINVTPQTWRMLKQVALNNDTSIKQVVSDAMSAYEKSMARGSGESSKNDAKKKK